MNLKIIRREKAKQDILELADYLVWESSLTIAERFVQSVEESFRLIAEMPNIGRLYECNNPQLSTLRVWPVKGFEKHILFYRTIPEGVEIIRVRHSARDIPLIFENDSFNQP
jgi:toxin ParE1/3/4